jgi:hypothetical protein
MPLMMEPRGQLSFVVLLSDALGLYALIQT